MGFSGKSKSFLVWMMLITYIHFVWGCTYYKVSASPNLDSVAGHIQENTRYFIVHQGDRAFHFTNIAMDREREELTGNLEDLPQNHTYYLTTKPDKPNRIKTTYTPGTNVYTPMNSPTYEVHIYISEYLEDEHAKVTIPFSAMEKIEIYDKDTNANTASAIFTTLGVVAGIIVIVGAIAFLTKSSCPFVYAYDGSAFQFSGEMYGGAIFPALERHDYMPLPGCMATPESYQLKISNELKEKQFTDLAELIVVDHPDSTRVILDTRGAPQAIVQPQAPFRAVSDSGADGMTSIVSEDELYYGFMEEKSDDETFSSLKLSFHKPADVQTGKLVIRAKNSYWLDYVYGRFNEAFGTYFNTFYEAQKKTPADQLNRWASEQGIPLSVYIMKSGGWERVSDFHVTGPLASREMVMPIDLSGTQGDTIQLKLECGFMFWELDYAAMDFSANIPVRVTPVSASQATDQDGHDVASYLVASDSVYLAQTEAGNAVSLAFAVPRPEAHHQQTFFLHSEGYYEYIRDYRNEPDLFTLLSFRGKAAFAKFAKREYQAYIHAPQYFNETITSSDGF